MDAYISTCKNAISNKNGLILAHEIALPLDIKYKNIDYSVLMSRLNNSNTNSIMNTCNNAMRNEHLASILTNKLYTIQSMYISNWNQAIDRCLNMYNSILEYLKDDNTSWALPVLIRISNDLRLLAAVGDGSCAGDEFTRKALENLTKGFTLIAKERAPVTTPGSRKIAIFAVTNVLFKIYFKVNTLQLCNKLINVIEMSGVMKTLQSFPVSDVITYFYYLGRLKLFEDKYIEARDFLTIALKHTPIHMVQNRQRVLCSLVPIQMLLGSMPCEVISTKYGLTELYELSLAVKSGNVALFDEIMAINQESFLKLGIYLLLQQIKIIVYRCLIKKIFHICDSHSRMNLLTICDVLQTFQYKEEISTDTNVDVDATTDTTCQWMNIDIDIDEVECILSNLIYSNKIKGYISHAKSILVLSKLDPFPFNAIVSQNQSKNPPKSIFSFDK